MTDPGYGDPYIGWNEADAANADGEAVMQAERETAEADAFPLTCGWCHHAPATHLLIMDVIPNGKQAAVRTEHQVCAGCAHQTTVLPPSFTGWWLYRLAPDDCGETTDGRKGEGQWESTTL